MYLSRLEIIGFKSFAQKVNLTFDSGMTGIVGPNGCGKTNIVDAIRWVLGEQKSSTLRSDKMEDVIFNGTRNRKPLSMAEVSLTIENTKGILPTEFAEVTITRRVYRSGESEYLFNGAPCRLKDIVDLFMDTGMGADAYSVIELKMVETILSDKAEERRRLFEEAAGVTKYKFRRKAAYRKLETVQQDLVRVNDIVKEVQKTVSTLEKQARKAEQYNELSQRLRTLEIDLLEREYAAVNLRLAPLEERLNSALSSKNVIDEMLSKEESHLDELRAEFRSTEENMGESRQALAALNDKLHGVEQKILLGNERRSSLEKNISRYENERRSHEERRQKLETTVGELRQKGEVSKAALQALEGEYAEKKSRLSVVESEWNAKRASLRGLNDLFVETVDALTKKKSELEHLRGRVENARGRIDRVCEENLFYEAETSRANVALEALVPEHKEARRSFVEVQLKLFEMETLKDQLKREVEEMRNKEFELRGEYEKKSSRLGFLKSLIETHDGIPEGTKYLINAGESRSFVQTTVGDAVSTESQYRTAIESALGETANYIVVNNLDEAYRGVQLLKRTQKGKATFICLNRIPAVNHENLAVSNGGAIGWALDLVEFDGKYESLFRFLLDRTLLVSDAEAARSFVSNGASLKCVTLEGEVITSSGVMKGGSRHQENAQTIGKRNQIVELEAQIKSLGEELAGVQRLLGEKSADLTLLTSKAYEDEVKKLEYEVAGIETKMAQLEFEKKRAQEAINRNQAEIEKREAEVATLKVELDTSLREVEGQEQRRHDLESTLHTSSREVEETEAQKNAATEIVNECWSRLVRLREEEREIGHELQYAETGIAEALEGVRSREQDIAASKEEIGRLSAEIVENEDALTRLRKERADLSEHLTTIESEYSAKREQLHSVEISIRDERRHHDDSLGAMHELEMKLSEYRIKVDNLMQRAKEEFDHDLELKRYPEGEEFSFGDAREEVRQLKSKIRALGPVNFAAFDEYKTEKQRFDFLTTQRNDLIEAEKTLLDTIEEINTTAQRKFLETFERIRTNFVSTFSSLFDEGDECDLRLEEDVDPLEGKIEIIAKPRGKRPQSIDLLSAGEKTLTAIALLFAIYLVKPSPFCILDEVDAPLDDSNIDRFTRILNKFSNNTQFIVVTHNKRTMEAANALYGVTMEEEGVSKLVSVRLTTESLMKN
ncbi:MAG: chromosome segregation protein SMC [Bacteroidota bacterium]